MTVQEQAALAAEELCEKARLGAGEIGRESSRVGL